MKTRGTRCSGAILLLLAALCWPGTAVAGPPARVSWVRGEAWVGSTKAPARHYPGNLLDGKAKTVSCFHTDKLLESTFTVGFTGKAGAKELRVVNGDGRGSAAFAKSARVAKFSLLEPAYERAITLEDKKGRQVIRLDPPIATDRVTIRIDEIHGEGTQVCLSDLIFVARGRPLSGPSPAAHPRWKGLASRVLGAWAAGPEGAAEKFLTLHFDGRYRFVLRPNDTDLKAYAVNGRWTLKGRRLTLTGGGPAGSFSLKLASEEDEMGELLQILQLRGKARGKKKAIPDRYRDRF